MAMILTDKEFKELREHLLKNENNTESVVDEFLKERKRIKLYANVPAGQHRVFGMVAYVNLEKMSEVIKELLEEDVIVLHKVKEGWFESRRWPVTTFILREGNIKEFITNRFHLVFNVKKDAESCFFSK